MQSNARFHFSQCSLLATSKRTCMAYTQNCVLPILESSQCIIEVMLVHSPHNLSPSRFINAVCPITITPSLQEDHFMNREVFTAGSNPALPCQQHRCSWLPAWLVCLSTPVVCTPLPGHAGPQLWLRPSQHAAGRQLCTHCTRLPCAKSPTRAPCLQKGQRSSSSARAHMDHLA